MVRKSSGQDAQQPYTLVVFYKGRVYNIPIRFIANMQQYALGREKKGEEVEWSTVHFSPLDSLCLCRHVDLVLNNNVSTELGIKSGCG